MKEKQVLVFRWGPEKYGVPVENVSGIISNADVNGQSIFGNPEGTIPLQGQPNTNSDLDIGFKAGETKSAIITHANGVPVLIIVDEVIQEKNLSSIDPEFDATVASLQIWKFK